MGNWDYFEEKYGKPFGIGSQCRVFADGDSALKVLNEEYGLTSALLEGYVLAFAEKIGISTSNLEGVYKEAGHVVIRMRKVGGEELANVMLACLERGDVDGFRHQLEIFIDIQIKMHTKTMDVLRSALANYRWAAQNLFHGSATSQARLLAYMDTLPEGDAFCHNDYHPYNVLLNDGEYIVIDWGAAGKGDPAGDVAHTYAIMLMGNEFLANSYLDMYLEKTGMDRELVMKWFPMHAMALYGILAKDDRKEKLKPYLTQFLAE